MKYTSLPEQLPKCSLVFIVECTVVEIVIIVHHAKQTLIKDLGAAQTSTVHAPEQVGVCYIYFTTYARNLAKSARKWGVGLYYVMGG